MVVGHIITKVMHNHARPSPPPAMIPGYHHKNRGRPHHRQTLIGRGAGPGGTPHRRGSAAETAGQARLLEVEAGSGGGGDGCPPSSRERGGLKDRRRGMWRWCRDHEWCGGRGGGGAPVASTASLARMSLIQLSCGLGHAA